MLVSSTFGAATPKEFFVSRRSGQVPVRKNLIASAKFNSGGQNGNRQM